MKTEMAIMFMILIALLLNREDFESSGWFSRGFIGLIYNGKFEKSKPMQGHGQMFWCLMLILMFIQCIAKMKGSLLKLITLQSI